MKKAGIVLALVLMLAALLLNISSAAAATDGYYNLSEASPASWEGTDGSSLKPVSPDYDYAYGDDASVTYPLPWSLAFYGQNFSGITADTNGNVWFNATGSAYSFNLASTGRGPVIATWNEDLSSSLSGGVFIQHKTNPERIVIEWQAETYTEEGESVPNSFEVVIFQNGNIRFDYQGFTTQAGADAGSGISRGDGSASLNLTTEYGNVFTLAGRSFLFTPSTLYNVNVTKDGAGSGIVTDTPTGISCGSSCSSAFAPGSVVTLTAFPGFGSEFTGWSGACSGTGACSLAVDADKNVTATFGETYAPAIAITSPAGTMATNQPTLNYTVSTGTITVMVDGAMVSKVSGDLLDPLADGPHVVRVEATNAAGHPGFAESSFTVDTTPPAVATITPASGSSNVPVRMSVLVQFAEPIDPASVTSAMLTLTSAAGQIPVDYRITTDAKSLIVTPQSKLAYATSYTFTLKAGVRDLLGNTVISDQTITFTTPMADPDLVGYWPMDGEWKDYSGAGNDGTAYGSSAFTDGRVPGTQSGSFVIDSALFSGSGGFVDTPPKFIDGAPDNFTMSFWAKPTATRESTPESNSNVMDGAGVQRFAIAPVNFYNLGYLGATAGVSVGTNGISVIEETTMDYGAITYGYMPSLLVYDSPTPLTGWNHVVVVYNNKQPSLYLNGTLVRTGLASTQFEVYPAAVFAFGNERQTGSYSGQLEGITIHKRALTAPEIQSLYQAQSRNVPQITITSPGQNVKYKPGDAGNATIAVASGMGITNLYCNAAGATSDGGLAIDFGQPQVETTRQLDFRVATDAAPYAPILLSCVAQTADGTLGAAQLQLQAADLVLPTVISSTPANNAVDVSATMPVTIYFSESIDPASVVNRDTLRFQRTDNGAWVTGMYRLSTDNKAMQILPVPALDGGTSYTITLSRLRDLAGNVMANDFALQFTTLQQTNLVIENQGTSAAPYALPTGRYGNLTLTNSYVSVSGGVAADTLSMDHSTLDLSPSTSVPGDLSVAYGDLNLTNSSQLTVNGALNLAANLNMTGSIMSVADTGTVAGNVALSGSTLTLKKPLHVTGDVSLQSTSILTHFAATKTETSKLDVTAANMIVDATSKIDVTGKGYLGGYPEPNNPPDQVSYAPGYTLGNTTSGGSCNNNGGSFGGHGGGSEVNAAYGDTTNPNELGSGGGGYYYDLFTGLSHVITRTAGGNGGGLIRLNVASLSLDGVIAADGAVTDASGGSGGSIYIGAVSIVGSGSISAKGGSAGNGINAASGGGGGRIAIYFNSLGLPVSSISATGGVGLDNTASVNGSAGTIYLKDNAKNPDLILNNSNIPTNKLTPVSSGRYGNVSIIDGALATVMTQGTVPTVGQWKLDIVAETIIIDASSKIDVTGKGFLGGYTPGNSSINGMTYDVNTQAATTTGGSTKRSGGSYGGPGGAGEGTAGAIYGNLQQPSELGSGGGGLLADWLNPNINFQGGNGGGLLTLTANLLTVNGSLLADGVSTGSYGGGGSGGGIWINVGALSGTGSISARGGASSVTDNLGGGGGGGRIAIYYGSNSLPLANISAAGGKNDTGAIAANNGGAGTIYLKDASRVKGDLIINNGGLTTSNTTTVAGGDYGRLTVSGGATTSVLTDISFDQDVTFTGSTLTFSGGITSTANLTLDGSTITVGGPVNVTNDLTLKNGSLLTHSAATALTKFKLDVTAGTITLNDTSKIDVSGRGFLGGYTAGNSSINGMTYDAVTQGPTITGGGTKRSGGSYGGPGGAGEGTAGAVYGNLLQPSEPGSGGGGLLAAWLNPNIYYQGGNGGGAVKLTANVLTLNGTGTGILADGASPGGYGGGGSGGGIWINVGTLSGTGTISAKGGTSSNSDNLGGGGGGGRIAIYYGSNSLSLANISAVGGQSYTGGSSSNNGGAGTIYMKDAARVKGDVIVYNGGLATSNITTVVGGDYGQVTFSGGAKMSISGDISFDQDVTFTGSTLMFSGGITSTANLTLDGSTITVGGPVNVANSLTLKNGSLLTHSATTATTAYKLDVSAGTITLSDTSKIDVTGRGFLGGQVSGNTAYYGMTYNPATQGPTTTGGSCAAVGGGYGGPGGAGSSNPLYGNLQQPHEPGSGGGSAGDPSYVYVGSNGGGAVKLTANVLNLNGTGTGILANGNNNISYGGGGSGGAIWINVGTLSGTGTISAKGGTAQNLGGGGGGRIAIYYDSNSIPSVNISAAGGKSNNGSTSYNGGAGTIYLKAANSTRGDVVIDNGGVVTSNVTTLAGGDYGQVTVSGGAKTSVSADISFDQDVTFAGSNLAFSGGITSTANLTLDGSMVTVNGPVNVANSLTLKNGSLLTHSATTATTAYKLDVSAGTITLSDTSKIDVTGRGFLGGQVSGNTAYYGMTYNPATQGPTTTGGSCAAVGGGYGGPGGAGSSNPLYGNLQQPHEPGSGGGSAGDPSYVYVGSNGGGAVKLTANVLNLNGTGTGILANGNNNISYGGGGSGGAIWINVGTLSGTGTISAKGGTAQNLGGGGGGRIAIYYGSNGLPAANISAAGGRSNNGSDSYNGADGTIYLYQLVFPLTVTKAGTGTGTVQSTPAGLACGTTCSVNFAETSSVTLTATPDSGSTFTAWAGACSGTGSCTVTMDAAKSVTATFDQVNPLLSVVFAGTGKGVITSSPAGIACNTDCSAQFPQGTQVTLSPSASEYSVFGGWSNGVCAGIGNCLLTLFADTSVTGSFFRDTSHQVSVGDSYYQSIQDAYNAAADGSVIRLWGIAYDESLACDRSVAITLQGGYDSAYLSITGETTLNGVLTVTDGTVIADGVSIQ